MVAVDGIQMAPWRAGVSNTLSDGTPASRLEDMMGYFAKANAPKLFRGQRLFDP